MTQALSILHHITPTPANGLEVTIFRKLLFHILYGYSMVITSHDQFHVYFSITNMTIGVPPSSYLPIFPIWTRHVPLIFEAEAEALLLFSAPTNRSSTLFWKYTSPQVTSHCFLGAYPSFFSQRSFFPRDRNIY